MAHSYNPRCRASSYGTRAAVKKARQQPLHVIFAYSQLKSIDLSSASKPGAHQRLLERVLEEAWGPAPAETPTKGMTPCTAELEDDRGRYLQASKKLKMLEVNLADDAVYGCHGSVHCT